MTEDRAQGFDQSMLDTLRALEQRLARIEAHLDLPPMDAALATERVEGEDASASAVPLERDLEFEVGQNWLASVGIIVLTCGVGFALLLPLGGLPPWLPSLAGGVIALALAALGFLWHRTFALVAGYFRGAGMALFYFAVLRLFFFGESHVLDIESAAGPTLLFLVVAANIAGAFYRRSAWLLLIALLTGFASLVAIGAPYAVFLGTIVLLGIGVWAVVTNDWPWLQLFLMPAGYLTHALWLIGRPWQGRPFELQARPALGVFFVLTYVAANAMASFFRRDRSTESAATIIAVLLNCFAGYALFVLATLAGSSTLFGPAHIVAMAVFLGLAMAFWQRERSQFSTFFYAMTGYLALSVALAKLIAIPQLFIWLSAQSLLVVATALWFRSRLIVFGNFFIYVGIVFAYVVTAKSENGISIVLGIVALLTARILGWQAERLEQRTEFMRNAYLASAFLVFPYALYHLVAGALVPVSWVAIAVAYYLMNFVVRSPKYRWMGHLTLLMTALYMIVVGIFQLAPAYRVASFLVLGTVLLVVSLAFTMVRARRREGTPEAR
jgi:hypothetical protein